MQKISMEAFSQFSLWKDCVVLLWLQHTQHKHTSHQCDWLLTLLQIVTITATATSIFAFGRRLLFSAVAFLLYLIHCTNESCNSRAHTHTHGHIHDSQALFCVFVAFNYYCTMTVSADIKHLNLFSVWIASHHSLVLLLSSTVLFTPALLICRCCELSLSWKNENKNCDKWKWKSLRQTGKSFVWFIFKMKSILAAATFFAFLRYFGWLTKVFLYAFYCCFVALFCVVCVFLLLHFLFSIHDLCF